MSLFDRIRPVSEAAPWVCEEVKELERELAEAMEARDAAVSVMREALLAASKNSDERDQWRGMAEKLARSLEGPHLRTDPTFHKHLEVLREFRKLKEESK